MTDQLTALRELVAKVEADDAPAKWDGPWVNVILAVGLRPDDRHLRVIEAYNGSLDAAKALHEALLPGWPFELRERAAWTNRKRGLREPGYLGEADNLARAWLIAVLKALIAKLEAAQ